MKIYVDRIDCIEDFRERDRKRGVWNSAREGESLEVGRGKKKGLNNNGKKRMIWFCERGS